MHKADLRKVRELAREARGQIDHVYVHWTAGHYTSLFDDYHFCITGKGDIYVSVDDLTTLLAHTWHRNSRAIGIALCCAADAMLYADGRFDLGEEPPTQTQLELVSQLLAVLCTELDIRIDERYVMTHSEAADQDGYGPRLRGTPQFERWDLWRLPDYDGAWRSGGEVLRGKALFYQPRMASREYFSIR